jgi:hypothetical protein
VHRIGHAQGCVVGRLRTDIPGVEVLVANHHGSNGVLTLFSGRGDRLWTIQPDYYYLGRTPLVTWGSTETQLIWVNTSGVAQALYDGYGRRVKPLPALSRLYEGHERQEVTAQVVRLGHAQTDFLSLTVDGRMYVFGPG